jgi:ABC-type transporter Mla subunit MlaD
LLDTHQVRVREVLMAKLHALLDNINATTAQLRSEVQPQADGTLLAKVHAALDKANTGLAEVTEMLAEDREPVHETLQSLQRTAGLVEHDIVGPIASELDLANTRSLLNQVRASFEKIDGTLADLQVVTGQAKTIVLLNEDRANRLMMNLSETASHLKSAAKDLRRNPWRLLYRPSLEETRQLNIFDAAGEFAEAAARLDDSATRLSALMKSHDGAIPADNAQLVEIRKRLTQTFEDYVRAEEALWKQLDVH